MKRTEPKKEAIRLTNLWQKFGQNTYPIILDDLIVGITQDGGFSDGLQVVKQPLESIEGALLKHEGERSWSILINRSIENSRRLRFTFAHELGHFMCHRDLQDSFKDSGATLNDYRDELEREANLFAAWLLMPANVMREEFSRLPWDADTLCTIGNRFECSLQATGLRYVSLSSKKVAFIVSRDGMIVWGAKSQKAPFISRMEFGDELPVGSQAREVSSNGINRERRRMTEEVWTGFGCTIESQYIDTSGLGFIYTCLSFE